MKKLNILVLLIVAIVVNAQTITGKILNETQPIPYAKIGVVGENIGAIADKDGNFQLNLDDIDRGKVVKIEVAGFEAYKTSVSDFVKTNLQNIQLKEKVREIAEVKISPKKYKIKNIGIKNGSNRFLFGFNSKHETDAIKEMAILIENKSFAKIEKVNFEIGRIVSEKPIVLAIEFYNEKDGLPNQIIETEPILYTADPKNYGDVSLNLDDKKIFIKGNFFVSVKIVNKLDGQFYLTSNIFALTKSTYLRYFYSNWTELKHGAPAINIDVKVDKNYRNEEEESKKNTTVDADIFLKNFQNAADLQEAARKTSFGSNPEAADYFKTNDHGMYYETYGSGEPLFLLHGNGGSIQAFYKQIDEFSKHYKVIAVDTRAQGNSKDFSTADFTYELFADDLKRLAEHLKIKKANIIGWSDGGIIGLIYAMKNPESVDKLITIGANTNPNGVSKSDLENMKSDLENLQKADSKNLDAIRLTKLMIEQPQLTKADLATIKTPTLIVAGENDIILREHTNEIAKAIPGAQLKIVKGATHSLIQEKPEEFNRFALKFLKTGKL